MNRKKLSLFIVHRLNRRKDQSRQKGCRREEWESKMELVGDCIHLEGGNEDEANHYFPKGTLEEPRCNMDNE